MATREAEKDQSFNMQLIIPKQADTSLNEKTNTCKNSVFIILTLLEKHGVREISKDLIYSRGKN